MKNPKPGENTRDITREQNLFTFSLKERHRKRAGTSLPFRAAETAGEFAEYEFSTDPPERSLCRREHHSEDKLPQHLLFNPSPRQVNSQSTGMAMLCTLSIFLSLLVPAHTTRSPDCGGILTPSGLRYLAEVSKPHAESVLRHDFTAPPAPDPSPISPSSRNQIISVKVDKFSLTLIPDTGMRLSIEVDLGTTSAPSTTKEMRLSILADLHVDMNPEGNLELVTSDCKPTLEEVQSTEGVTEDRSAPQFSSLWDLGTFLYFWGGFPILMCDIPCHKGAVLLELCSWNAFNASPVAILWWFGILKSNHSLIDDRKQCKSSGSDVDKQINVEKICLEVSKLLLFPNERLMSLAAPFPITPSCQVQYLPLAAPMYSEQGIIISLQTTFQVAGTVIPLPVSPVPFSMPEPVSSSPSHLILAFSEHFYTSLFSALEESGALNVSLLSSLTTATLAERITQMGSLFQEDLPVVLQAVTRSSPHVALEEDKAIVKLFLTAQIGAGSSLFQSFLSVNVDVTARLHFSVADTRMIISVAAVEDIELSLAASDVGPVLAALLEELFLPTVREKVPAQINVVLRQGVFLPHITSFTYTDVNITIHKDYVLIPCNLQLEAKTGEASTRE
ncbi:BPI fold-containing family B member 2 [Cyanocitta cristata]